MTLHLEGLFGDLRFAARSLRRSPGFAATTVVSLALGVALHDINARGHEQLRGARDAIPGI